MSEYKLKNVKPEDLYAKKSRKRKERILKNMVMFALKNGNKPAARKYNTYPATVRRWVKRYNEQGIEGLKYNRPKRKNTKNIQIKTTD